MPPSAAAVPPAGTVLLRVPVRDRGWPRQLPTPPLGWRVTVTVGDVDLLPGPGDGLEPSGYVVAGVAADHRPLGSVVDLLVPSDLRHHDPAWWTAAHAQAARVFDLSFGPVARLLAAEVDLHLRAV